MEVTTSDELSRESGDRTWSVGLALRPDSQSDPRRKPWVEEDRMSAP